MALSRLLRAEVTWSCAARSSSRTRSWPALTESPSLTSTSVTVPEEANGRLMVCSAATEPLPATVAVSAPRVTVVVAGASVAARLDVPRTKSAATTTMMTARIANTIQRREDRRRSVVDEVAIRAYIPSSQ